MTVLTTKVPVKMKNVSISSSSTVINWDDSFEDVRTENLSLQSSEEKKYNESKGEKSGKEILFYDTLGFKSGDLLMNYLEKSRDAGYALFSYAEAIRLAPKIKHFSMKVFSLLRRKRISIPFLEDGNGIKAFLIKQGIPFVSDTKSIKTYQAQFLPTNGQKIFYLVVLKDRKTIA